MRLAALLLALPLAAPLSAQDGASLYQQHCASCHDSPTGRIPPLSTLKTLSISTIRAALENGKMQPQAAALSAAERDRLARFLGKAPAASQSLRFCQDTPSPPFHAEWNGWSPGLRNERLQPNPGFAPADIPKLKLKWAFSLGDGLLARSQPTLAAGKLFIGAQSGAVFALHPSSGCVHWTFSASSQVRSGLVLANGVLFFGDGKANVYALDASTGQQLWKVQADPHPMANVTGTVQHHNQVLYVPIASSEEVAGGQPKYPCCTFRGSLVALDAKTGKQLWKTYTITEMPQPTKRNSLGTQLHGPSGAGVWSSPTIDTKSNRIYIATGDNYSEPASAHSDAVLALDLPTGRILWSRQFTPNDVFVVGCGTPGNPNCPETPGPDHDIGQSPILVDLPGSKRVLVVGQKSGVVHALDPDAQGKILWQTRVGAGGVLGGIQWGSAADREKMYVAVADIGFTRIAGRSRLHPAQGGGLFALQLATGEKIWAAPPAACPENKPGCSPGHSAAVTATPAAVFAGSLDGHLRAFSTANGKVLWDFDTARDFETVNGAPAKGGSIDGPGPVIAGGMVFTNSGYGIFGGMPGNVLLAFSVDGN